MAFYLWWIIIDTLPLVFLTPAYATFVQSFAEKKHPLSTDKGCSLLVPLGVKINPQFYWGKIKERSDTSLPWSGEVAFAEQMTEG